MTISTFNILEFTPTQHFKERLLERFGITENKIDDFLKNHQSVHNTFMATHQLKPMCISPDGTMFVLNIADKTIVTVFKSISPEMADKQKELFQHQLKKLVDDNKISTTKNHLVEIKDTIDSFHNNAMNIINNLKVQTSFEDIDQLYKDMSIIKTTLGLLTKQFAFYDSYLKDDNQIKSNTASLSTEETTTKDSNDNHDQKSNNVYEPNIPNADLIKYQQPMKNYLTSQQKQLINNWFVSNKMLSLSSRVMNLIKSGSSKTQLLASIQPQMKIIQFNKFKAYLTDILK